MVDPVKQPTRFAPVVLAGITSAAVLAVASSRPWIRIDLSASARVGLTDEDLRADSPLALALSLVVLAAWGVVLVSRRRVRRVVLALALLADVGILACALRAPATLPDQIRNQLTLGDAGSASPTVAYVVAIVAAIAGPVVLGQALRYAPRWPEMSSRYDAPTSTRTETAPAEDLPDLELWKAMDEGRDPTER
jgi:uncharacterized membrane protein (TIGR02234 family)